MIDYVKHVAESKRDRIFSSIEKCTKQLVIAIHDEDFSLLKSAIFQNEHLLEELGVVSKSTQKLIASIEKVGGVAKISGAGGIKKGSGMVLGVLDDPKEVAAIAKSAGFLSEQLVLGGEGVKIEQIIL